MKFITAVVASVFVLASVGTTGAVASQWTTQQTADGVKKKLKLAKKKKQAKAAEPGKKSTKPKAKTK